MPRPLNGTTQKKYEPAILKTNRYHENKSLLFALLMSTLSTITWADSKVDYVKPFVGTDRYGNVYPGAQTPFGGIQTSPDTDFKCYDAASGYKYNHTSILGFSLTHLSGTGVPDLGNFLFIPGTGEMNLTPGKRDSIAGS